MRTGYIIVKKIRVGDKKKFVGVINCFEKKGKIYLVKL